MFHGVSNELLKESLGLAVLYHSMPYGRPPLKWPKGRFRGGQAACGHLTTPFDTPFHMGVVFCGGPNGDIEKCKLHFRDVATIYHARTAWGIQGSSKMAVGCPQCE
jgi:hypothetical protein